MKYFIILVGCLLSTTTGLTQTKSIELFELIKLFAPDSARPVNYVKLNAYKLPKTKILIKGKVAQPDEAAAVEQVLWSGGLNPSKKIYTLQAEGYKLLNNTDIIKTLFGEANVESTSIKKCAEKDSGEAWSEIMEMKIPLKKTIWIKFESTAMYGPYIPLFEINCYANKKDIPMCNY